MVFAVLAALVLIAPVAALFASARKNLALRRQLALFASTVGTGAAAGLCAVLIERSVQRYVEIDSFRRVGGFTVLWIYAFFAAPLEMALVAAALLPFWRLRRARLFGGSSQRPAEREAMALSAFAAAGLSIVKHAFFLWVARHRLDLLRALFGGAGMALLCSLWGYALGRSGDRGMRGRRFGAVWLGAAFFLAVQDELLFHQGARALFSAALLLACAAATAWFLWRDPKPAADASSSGRLSMLLSAPAPSIGAIREAFRRQDRPKSGLWIGFGALVNTGLVVTGVATAVLVGRRLGVDFSAADRSGTATAAAPALLLGMGALSGFPSAGYLLARASGTRSVLEPALSSVLAMVLLLVFLGILAPAGLVFVMALMPIGFGLSCAGAWFGVSAR